MLFYSYWIKIEYCPLCRIISYMIVFLFDLYALKPPQLSKYILLHNAYGKFCMMDFSMFDGIKCIKWPMSLKRSLYEFWSELHNPWYYCGIFAFPVVNINNTSKFEWRETVTPGVTISEGIMDVFVAKMHCSLTTHTNVQFSWFAVIFYCLSDIMKVCR